MRLYFRHLNVMERDGGARPFISLTPWFVEPNDVQRESWNPGEDVAVVMGRLVARLEEANANATVQSFDPGLTFENLRTSLEVALRSRRGDLERRLRGPLIELFDGRWAITDEGIESLTDDTFVSVESFPGTLPQFQDPGTPSFVPPPAPVGVQQATWETLVAVARRTYQFHGSRPVRRKGFG